jgi:hypothetical protein
MINKPYVRLTDGILGTDTSAQASSLIQITYAIYHTFEEKQVHSWKPARGLTLDATGMEYGLLASLVVGQASPRNSTGCKWAGLAQSTADSARGWNGLQMWIPTSPKFQRRRGSRIASWLGLLESILEAPRGGADRILRRKT